MTDAERDRNALEWQTGVWNRISDVYVREIDERFAPVVEAVIARARLTTGESVLDVGVGRKGQHAKCTERVEVQPTRIAFGRYCRGRFGRSYRVRE